MTNHPTYLRTLPVDVLPAAVVRVLVAAALGVDAYVHFRNASSYDGAAGRALSEGTLFRAQATVAALTAVLVLTWPRRPVWAAALLVAGSALGAVLLYRYVDVGDLGPIPNMFEPTWGAPGKLASAYAEGAATVLAALALLRREPIYDPRALTRTAAHL